MRRCSTLGRRAFLGGAAALVATPVLRSLRAGRVRAQDVPLEPPRRFIAYYVPNGFDMTRFTPEGAGTDYALSPTLEPLSPHRRVLSVLSGLRNAAGQPHPGQGGLHAAATGSFLTGVQVSRSQSDLENGISLDQLLAPQLSAATRLRSLELGIEAGTSAGGCDFEYSCAYTRNIAWSATNAPVPKLTSPRAVLDRLFAGTDARVSAEEAARRAATGTSVLDFVLDDARSLRADLNGADAAKLDEFLTSARELEQRVQVVPAPLPARCEEPTQQDPADYPEHVRMMADLMVLALRCDLTRVVSFMLGNANTNRSYAFLGVEAGHHDLSHHDGDAGKLADLAKIDRWEIEQLAYLIERLRQPEADAAPPLLDSLALLFSSELSDGNVHSIDGLPVILAGRAGGTLTPGSHVIYEPAWSRSSLYVSIASALGVPLQRFGDDGVPGLPGIGAAG